VNPPDVFVGRTLTVELSGFATHWTSTSTVDFGADVTVNSITVGSATALLANITAAPTATPGPRNVTVTDGTGSVTLSDLFSVQSPAMITLNGTIAQGGVADLTFANQDISHPFDTTQDITGAYTNFNLANLPSGVSYVANAVSAYTADVFVFVDVDAAAGAFSAQLQSGPPGGEVTTFPVAGLSVTSRSATPVTSGAASGSISQLYGSSLFSYATTAPSTVEFQAAVSGSSAATPGVVVLPASGHFSDILGYGTDLVELSQHAGTFYLIVFDNSGAAASYGFQLTATETATTFVAPVTNNGIRAHALSLPTLPAAVVGSSLDTLTDNWFQITATSADVSAGKAVNVSVLDNLNIDVTIDVTDSSDTSLGGPAADLDAFTSNAIPAEGTYYVHISQGSFFSAPSGPYDLLVTLQ
jgi:hypothetical protein